MISVLLVVVLVELFIFEIIKLFFSNIRVL